MIQKVFWSCDLMLVPILLISLFEIYFGSFWWRCRSQHCCTHSSFAFHCIYFRVTTFISRSSDLRYIQGFSLLRNFLKEKLIHLYFPNCYIFSATRKNFTRACEWYKIVKNPIRIRRFGAYDKSPRNDSLTFGAITHIGIFLFQVILVFIFLELVGIYWTSLKSFVKEKVITARKLGSFNTKRCILYYTEFFIYITSATFVGFR